MKTPSTLKIRRRFWMASALYSVHRMKWLVAPWRPSWETK